MKLFQEMYRGRRILVTGNSGFKGSNLALMLTALGAELRGYSLSVPTEPALFKLLKLPYETTWGDVLDIPKLERVFADFLPEAVFHLAAQPVVRRSYREPRETFAVNVMGTVNVLEAARKTPSVRAVVVVTSDKCYENTGCRRGYVESDPLGGFDPYSASKGCAELVTASYRRSFGQSGKLIASVRAGNVVGGGDWAEDRLVSDLMRAAAAGLVEELRSPEAVRPWQHVFEPLTGYLLLGQRLLAGESRFADGWNFGPQEDEVRTVKAAAELLANCWPRIRFRPNPVANAPHEAAFLTLNSEKARRELGWSGVWSPDECFCRTAQWYRDFYERGTVNTYNDFECYVRDAAAKGLPWTR